MTQHHRRFAEARLGFTSRLFLLLMFCGAFTVLASAQRYLGAIGGQISDASGAKIPGASVKAVEAATHFTTGVVTGSDGAYSMPALQPGNYTVTITAKGFRTESRTDVILTAGQSIQLDVDLPPGTVNETVEVEAETSLIDTSSPTIATTLSTQEVTDLPNEGRNPFVMAALAPGVVDTASGGYFQGKSSQYTNPFSGVSVQITTLGTAGHNRLTLNGMPDDAAERFSGASYTNFVPSPEAVEEVKLENGTFDAQIGHGNGTVTNTVIRTGKNDLHGSAYYVFQNTYLNANTYEKAGNGLARNNDQWSQTGLVIDGPVRIPKVYNGRDKTFFMFSLERYATHTALNYSGRVPTTPELAGDFSGLCSTFNSSGLCTSGVQLYVPNSPVDVNGNRTAYYANNNIASALNTTGKAFATYMPGSNVAGATTTSPVNYISAQTSFPATYPSFIGRFDQAFGQKNKLNVIGFRSGLTQSYPMQGFPKGIGPTTSTSGYGYSVFRNNRGGSVDDTQQFSDTMVLDSRFGLIYHPFGLIYPGNAGYNLASLGITSTVPIDSFPGEYMSSDGYAGLAPGAGGQISEDTLGSFEEILTKIWGHHSVRFGFEGNMSRYNVQNPQSGFGINASTNPGFVFDRRFTQQNVNAAVGSDAASGDPMASMLMGYFATANYNINIAYALQQVYMAPFAQDDWRFSDKLTLNLGMRWDYESPFTERYNRMNSSFCTTCANPLQSSVSGLTLKGGLQFTSSSDRFPYQRDLHNWQPRLGAAYSVTPKTVVRAGFGIIFFNTLETPFASGYSQASSYTYGANAAVNGTSINTMNNPYPNGVTLPTGNTLGLGTSLGQAVNFNDPAHVQPRSADYTLNVQQQLPNGVALQIGYVGVRSTRLEVSRNINALPTQYFNQGSAEVTYLNAKVANPMAGLVPNNAALNGATIQQYLLLLPYPEFGTVTENYSSTGSAPYNALQVQVSRPMRNHFSLQGNLTWDKVMIHTAYLNAGSTTNTNGALDTHLESVQDPNATIVANVFGTIQLPKFKSQPYIERLLLGGWQFNGVFRAANAPLVPAPAGVNIIGQVKQPNPTYARYFNTCYENASGALVATTASAPGCDSLSPTPAYQQRLAYTTQSNSLYIGVRERIHPLVDSSLFKQFALGEGRSFEIRGEFFNILNTPNFGAPGTSIGSSSFGVVTQTQVNDPRIGQLTARINF